MGPNIQTAGGGAATGLADQFVNLLQNGLGGQFGFGGGGGSSTVSRGGVNVTVPGGTAGTNFANANPVGSTTGIAGTLNDILSGGAGNLGGSLGKLLQTQQTNDVAALRSRFGAGGGMSMGTPAAYAESTYRAQAAPQIATQTGALQMSALMPILQMISQMSGKGIPQAETFASPSGLTQFMSMLGGLGQGAGSVMSGIGAMG